MLESHYNGVPDELTEKCKGLEVRLRKLSENGRFAHDACQMIGWLLNDLHNADGFKDIIDKCIAEGDNEVAKWEDGFKKIIERIENSEIPKIVKFLNENE